jgi:hypothetical protein
MSLERCSIVWKFWDDAARSRRFLMTAATTRWFLVRWLAVAYAIESLMIAWNRAEPAADIGRAELDEPFGPERLAA